MRRRVYSWGFACVLALSGAAPVPADTITAQAAAAAEAAEAGNYPRAFERLQEPYELLWDATPLYANKALFVKAADGYGLYTERERGATFAPDEPLLLYLEPVGFGYGDAGTGSYVLAFDVDLTLLTEDGREVFSRDDFASLVRPLRYRNREFFVTVNLSFTGLPAGEYRMQMVLRDQNADKSMQIELPFSILDRT